jgi:hypothetical protein
MLGLMPTVSALMTPTELMCTAEVNARPDTTDTLTNGIDAAAVTKTCLVTRSLARCVVKMLTARLC